jgi:glutathione gamma-glutamylcysteinyltransferase
MSQTLYRRALPSDTIAFSSPEGRGLFAEAFAAEGLNGYFPLAEQFHTQSDPAFCGLGSLVVALNALSVDPGRQWKGPWRWFSEELLDCCAPLAHVREHGIDIDEFACLARCNGADVQVHRDGSLAEWREALAIAASGEAVVITAYDRAVLGQTGSGHFSPIGGTTRQRISRLFSMSLASSIRPTGCRPSAFGARCRGWIPPRSKLVDG